MFGSTPNNLFNNNFLPQFNQQNQNTLYNPQIQQMQQNQYNQQIQQDQCNQQNQINQYNQQNQQNQYNQQMQQNQSNQQNQYNQQMQQNQSNQQIQQNQCNQQNQIDQYNMQNQINQYNQQMQQNQSNQQIQQNQSNQQNQINQYNQQLQQNQSNQQNQINQINQYNQQMQQNQSNQQIPENQYNQTNQQIQYSQQLQQNLINQQLQQNQINQQLQQNLINQQLQQNMINQQLQQKQINQYNQQMSQNPNNQSNVQQNFQMNNEMFIEYKFNKSAGNVNLGNDFCSVKNNYLKTVYIITKEVFEKLNQPQQQNPFEYLQFFTLINDVITCITQTNKELYFVKEQFFSSKGLQDIGNNSVNFYRDENKIILFFPKESQNNKTLELRIKNDSIQKQVGYPNINMNINPKENTFKKIILYNAFFKDFPKLMKMSINDEYDIKEFYLVNRTIIENFKSEHQWFIQLIIDFKNDISYKGYLKNLPKLNQMNQNLFNNQRVINYQLDNKYRDENQFIPKFNKYFHDIPYPTEFILLPEALFNLFYTDFYQHQYKKEDFKYNVIFGNDILFVQNKIDNKIFNAYKIDQQTGFFEIFCAFKYNEENLFYSDIRDYVKGAGIEKYLKARNFDVKNKINQVNHIADSNNVAIIQYIIFKQISLESSKIEAIKKEIKTNLDLYEQYINFIHKINNLKNTNNEINNVINFEENSHKFKIDKCIVISVQNFNSIKDGLYFDKMQNLFNLKNNPNYTQEESKIINDIMNNPKTKNIKEQLNQALIFNGMNLDENLRGKVFTFINLELIHEIYNTQELPNKFIVGDAFIFINKNNYYLYYTKSKNLYKIANLNQNQFSIEEVNVRKGFQIVYDNLSKLVKYENYEKGFLKYSLKNIKPESYYCINQKWLNEFKKYFYYEAIKNNNVDFLNWNQYIQQYQILPNELINTHINLPTEPFVSKNINVEIPKNFEIIRKDILDPILKEINARYDKKFKLNNFYHICFGGNKVIIQDSINPQIYLIYSKMNISYNLDYIINIQDSNFQFKSLFEKCVGEETMEQVFTSQYKINLREKKPQELKGLSDKIGEIYVIKTIEDVKHCLGLQNIGATCYMNATIQCLCHVLNLKNYFLNKELVQKDIQNKNCPLTIEFSKVINTLWQKSFEGKNYYAPYGFKDIISKMNPLFEGVAANDSKDLIIFLYENIHKEINNPQNPNNKYQNAVNNPELQEFRTEYYPKNYSAIIDTFYFEHENQIKCTNCKFIRTNYNIYNILVFPLEKVREFMVRRFPGNVGPVTLENCFEQYQDNELLSGRNKIYCNKCNQMSDADNINKLYNSPEVLTIILNRGKGLQFDVAFDYPLLLNIDRFIVDENCKNNNYELICVLSHLGESGMSGHFIAFCKSPVDGKWYMYNDAQVNECSSPKNPENTIIESLPYVLYYQKIKTNKNNPNAITLYITYYDKEVYIDVEKEISIAELINRLMKKYNYPSNIILNLLENNNLIQLSPQSTLANYPNIKNGSKIIVKVF